MDEYLKRAQEYAAKNRRKTIEEAMDASPPAPTTQAGGMSQADFGGKKEPPNAARRAKLAELLKKQAETP